MKKPFVPVIVGALLGICVMLFADVKTDYSHHTDFAKYNTYSWINVHAPNQLWVDRIKNDVNQALESRGWTEVPNGGEASVSAFSSTTDVPTLNTFYNNMGGGWRWGGGFGEATTTEEETPEGTLVVDIFDTPTKQLIWRSKATNTLSGSPEKNSKKLEKTVEDMFKKFPPQPKG